MAAWGNGKENDWAIAATKLGSGFAVLLDGASNKEGQYYVWYTNSSGVVINGSGWKTAAQATQLGWEEQFNSDLNGDGNLGLLF